MWDDNTISIQELGNARSFELKKSTVDFLASLYKVNSHKNVFDQASVEKVFMSSPFGAPWQISKETLMESSPNDQNDSRKVGISVENWIGLWLKHFNQNPK